jgi:alcohol dehydrogenase class IV
MNAAPSSFEFTSVPRLVVGRGTFSRIGELAAELGSAAMIVTNAGQPGDGGLADRLADLLSAAKLRSACWRQRGEPKVDDIDAALEIARGENCDVVLGVGGGSAIDAAKAVAGLLTNGGSPLDYMEVIGKGQKLTRPAAPWIAVPTTAGTGAEVTRNAVIGSPRQRFKASLRSPHLLARVALVDAELGLDVRPEVTARSGMDALCQLVESYTSNRAQPITDGLAMKGIALAAPALPRVYADGHDVEAREDMALAALLSGMTLANAGLGAVHGFAAPMGANLPLPHGTVCAALLPHVMRANVDALRSESPEHPYLKRYAHIGCTLTGEKSLSDNEAIERGIQFAVELAERLQIPPLRDFGLKQDNITELVNLAGKASSMRYNPVTLSEEALTGILQKAM